jgi:hypothetical protein
MTLRIERVGYAKYRADGSIAFYVRCEGLSETIETSIQQGAKNEYNNSVLQAWLDDNIPDSYSTAADDASDALTAHKMANLELISKPANIVAAMTDEEKAKFNSDMEAYGATLTSLCSAIESADDAHTAYILEKEKVFD